MSKKSHKINSGYTIIETMIAISIFLVVMLYGMTALLNANLIQAKSQNMHSIMDNLSFAMEEMSRNLRMGYNYNCISGGSKTTNCEIGEGVSFTSAYGGQWTYYINNEGFLSKTVNGQETILTSPEIVIDSSSGFSIVGADPAPIDESQPLVRIILKGEIMDRSGSTPFFLQTSISQRLIDVLIPEDEDNGDQEEEIEE